MFAYLIPNTKLDSIESITGIDFYPQLKTELESKLESVKNSLPPE